MYWVNSSYKAIHLCWKVVILFVFSLYLTSNSIASSHDHNICTKILNSTQEFNNSLYYISSSGEPTILKQDELFSKNIKSNVLYYLRSKIRAPGGVLVVKTAHGTNSKDRRVKLKRGRLPNKNIPKECIQEDVRTKKFFKKYKNEDKSIYASTTVGYNIFQTYAGSRNDKDAKNISEDDYNKLKGWHFKFKNPRTNGSTIEYKCLRTDDIYGNRMQSSLRISNTGPQNFFNNTFRVAKQFIKRYSSNVGRTETSNWTVTLVAFDKASKKSSRACIKLTIPELKKAKLIRINDLSYRPGGSHMKDIEYGGR